MVSVFCNVKWLNVFCFDLMDFNGKCFYFIVVSEGKIFVVFFMLFKDKLLWYYIEIIFERVVIYKVIFYFFVLF